MKKILVILLLAATSLFAQPTNYPGSGTLGDPWQISTVAQLDSLRYNSETAGAGTTWYWKLTDNIDMTGVTNWVPIFNATSPNKWNGSIDGNGKTISNLTLDTTLAATGHHYLGLFGNLGSGDQGQVDDGIKIIHDLRIDNFDFDIDGTATGWSVYIGLLSGLAAGSIGTNDVEIDSIIITNSTLTVDMPTWAIGGGTLRMGGLTGMIFRAHHLYVDADIIFNALSNTLQAEEGVGGVAGCQNQYMKEIAFVGTIVSSCPGMPVGGIAGRTNVSTTADSLTDSYVRSDRIESAYYTAGILGMNLSEANGRFRNLYAQVDTLHGIGTTQDVDGYLIGYTEATGPVWTNCYADTQNVAWGYSWGGAAYDTWDRTLDSDTEVTTNGQDTAKTTALMNAQSTFYTFDFVNIWAIDSGNDGYPYLQWVDIGPSKPILNHPDSSGNVFIEGDTVLVHWTASDDTVSTEIYMAYSIDAGSNFTTIDTVDIADTSYTWVVPDAPTVQGRFRILYDDTSYETRDSSSSNFTILTSSLLDIYYPKNKSGMTITPGDTLHINIESQFVEDIFLWWSRDSLVWNVLDSVAVDTTNGQYLDSTTYVWTFSPLVSGPEVWVMVAQQDDTTLYSFSRDFADLGIRYPVGTNVCQNDSGGTLIEKFYHYDPSCGWSSPPHTYYNNHINDLGEGYTLLGQAYTWPYAGAQFPRLTGVYIITGSDTVLTDLNTFYDEYGATVTYLNRLYYIEDQTLKCNDLVNGINGIVVSDLSDMYTGTYPWIEGEEEMQVYHVQHSKISGQYHANSTVWETLNDSWFSPKILINTTNDFYPDNTITVNALPAPASGDPAEDTQKVLTGSAFERYLFRGIHPKIDRDR
jgi:hypothetical protein